MLSHNHAALRDLLDNQQSTHGFAPEASAVRLIRLLREAYSPIQTRLLTEIADPALLRSTPLTVKQLEIQAFLVQLVEVAIRRNQNLPIQERAIPPHLRDSVTSWSFIVRMLVFFDQSQKWSRENKVRILQKMRSLIVTHPEGEKWNLHEQQWSINRIYNPATQAMDVIIVSPAETLNLVCRAVLDNERYEGTDDVTALNLRLESLGNYLLKMRKQEEQLQHEYCSAGQSHGLLALLQDTYLDRPRSIAGATPIHMIANEGTFLQETLSRRVKESLALLSPEDRLSLMITWMQWSERRDSDGPSPLIEYLNQDADWQSKYQHYLIEQCHYFGLNDGPLGIADYLSTVADLAPEDCAADKAVLTVLEMAKLRPLSLEHEHPDNHALLTQYNIALDCFQKTLTPRTTANVIQDFYIAMTALESICDYHNVIGFSDVIKNGDFKQREAALREALQAYYRNEDVTKRLPCDFESQYTQYAATKEQLLKITLQQLGELFSLPITAFTPEQRQHTFKRITPQLGEMITTLEELIWLLQTCALSEEQLTPSQRTTLFTCVMLAKRINQPAIARVFRQYPAAFCNRHSQLTWWFSLSVEEFSIEQRTQLLDEEEE